MSRLVEQRNRFVFGRMLRAAQRAQRREDWERVGIWAAAAALFATKFDTGLTSSDTLDDLLERLGQELPAPVATPAGARRRALHVMSHGDGTDEHSRKAVAWMAEHDAVSSVFLTEQTTCPPQLTEAVGSTGGEVVVLYQGAPLRRRANALRLWAARSDAVVLSHLPHDAVPLVALSYQAPPPIMLLSPAHGAFRVGLPHVSD